MKNQIPVPSLSLVDSLPFPQKQIAQIASGALDYLQTRHDLSWARAYKSGHSKGYVDGRNEGYAEGKEHGKQEGYEEGRRIVEIRDLRDVDDARPGSDKFLFENWEILISPEVEAKMRADVKRLLSKQPTPDQWKMIFSRTPSTCVVAGAGSGKSTTLILRLLLLHYYLKFDWGTMTVVTFTNMSRIDFIKKLREVTDLWGISMSDGFARTIVNTFHSKIIKFTEALHEFGSKKVVAFENVERNTDGSLSAVETDNPFDTRLNDAQRELLNGCYSSLYDGNLRFRTLVDELYQDSLTLDKEHVDKDAAIEKSRHIASISNRDTKVMDYVENAWRKAGQWPIEGVIAKREAIFVKGKRFEIHGRIEGEESVGVVLMPLPTNGNPERRPGAAVSIATEMSDKKLVFGMYCNQKITWVKKASNMAAYVEWLADRSAKAPDFDFQLHGDLGQTPLLECFVNAAAFIENLGLNVSDTISKMTLVHDTDRRFFEALGIYWKGFMDYLDEQTPRIMTYNRMFATFSEGARESFRQMPDALIRSMSQLMIDEFQDVSPQIVSWVRGSLLEIRRREPEITEKGEIRHGSLMCVGDDWQSIYGWRGSLPKYFIDYENEFESPDTTHVMLRENYRSHQLIIDAAESIVADAEPSIPGKGALAARKFAGPLQPVQIHDMDNNTLLQELANFHYDAGETVHVLYREGKKEKDRLTALLKRISDADAKLEKGKQRLRIMTIHKSKGLEADAVLVLGDCVFKKSSPYKNEIYRIAGLGSGSAYDKAQVAELLRLAYVAITRAEKYCYWFVPIDKTPSKKPKASSKIKPGSPCFEDRRKNK